MTALNRRKFLAMLSAATAGTAVAPLGSVCPKTHCLIIKQHVAYYFSKEDLQNSGQNCHK
jgi:hypothetical protein